MVANSTSRSPAQGGPADAPGALVVRRSIQIDATPERIWREFETPERFAAWWTTDMPDRRESVRKYDPRVGGRVEMPCAWDGGSCVFEGNVTVFEPKRELTFELGLEGVTWDAPTYVTIRLTPNAFGTMVEILHWGFEHIGASAVQQFSDFEGGWDLRELRALKSVVESA